MIGIGHSKFVKKDANKAIQRHEQQQQQQLQRHENKENVMEGGIGFTPPFGSPPTGALAAAHIKHATTDYLHREKSGPLSPSPHAAFSSPFHAFDLFVWVYVSFLGKGYLWKLNDNILDSLFVAAPIRSIVYVLIYVRQLIILYVLFNNYLLVMDLVAQDAHLR